MNLEYFSYVYDFSFKINYKGNLIFLQQAMTSSAISSKINYEPLETLGDSIIKFLTTLDLYILSSSLMDDNSVPSISPKQKTEIFFFQLSHNKKIKLDQCFGENTLTEIRSFTVSNKNLADISRKLEFYRFLKTTALPIRAFRPAYYKEKAFCIESIEIEQIITDSVLADFFEAVVGSFYMNKGLLSAAKFLKRVGLISIDS